MTPTPAGLSCPIPLDDYPEITLAHGGGGRLMHRLIEEMMLPVFGSPDPSVRHDGAVLASPGRRLAFTTDSHVVTPLFFPGGDIGSLAIHGTVNDLAVCGAKPLWLSVGFILEEGLPMETLWRVVRSMGEAAVKACVQVVTGDTKVVERGKADGVFINTAGIGSIAEGVVVNPSRISPGDAVIVSGDIGRHGIAVMSVREGMGLVTTVTSDLAPISPITLDLLSAGLDVHCMRDLTRGGLAGGLYETVSAAGLTARIEEDRVPVREDVLGACELLGFDPLYVANEGRFILFLPQAEAEAALNVIRRHPGGELASMIGSVASRSSAPVIMRSLIGSERIVDLLSGEQLPRIC